MTGLLPLPCSRTPTLRIHLFRTNKMSFTAKTESEWIARSLPKHHNQQDIIYLKARYAWQFAKKGDDGNKLFEAAMDTYQGTTFQQKYYPKKEIKNDRPRQAQQSLFPDQEF